nr:hypothetical protein Iba_chr01aCG21080 [Ipomoea batatas]
MWSDDSTLLLVSRPRTSSTSQKESRHDCLFRRHAGTFNVTHLGTNSSVVADIPKMDIVLLMLGIRFPKAKAISRWKAPTKLKPSNGEENCQCKLLAAPTEGIKGFKGQEKNYTNGTGSAENAAIKKLNRKARIFPYGRGWMVSPEWLDKAACIELDIERDLQREGDLRPIANPPLLLQHQQEHTYYYLLHPPKPLISNFLQNIRPKNAYWMHRTVHYPASKHKQQKVNLDFAMFSRQYLNNYRIEFKPKIRQLAENRQLRNRQTENKTTLAEANEGVELERNKFTKLTRIGARGRLKSLRSFPLISP